MLWLWVHVHNYKLTLKGPTVCLDGFWEGRESHRSCFCGYNGSRQLRYGQGTVCVHCVHVLVYVCLACVRVLVYVCLCGDLFVLLAHDHVWISNNLACNFNTWEFLRFNMPYINLQLGFSCFCISWQVLGQPPHSLSVTPCKWGIILLWSQITS